MDKKDLIPENNEVKDELAVDESAESEVKAESAVNENEEAAEEITAENSESSDDFSADEPAQEVAENARKVTTENVDFDTDDSITVVSDLSAEKGKKLPVIIAACVLAVVVIISAVIYFVNANDKNNDNTDSSEGVSEEDYVQHAINPELDKFISEAMTEEMTDADGNVISREEYVENLKQQVQEATTTLNDDVGVISPNEIVENTTQSANPNASNGTQAGNQEQVNKAEAHIKAFLNRSCYIQGAMYSGGTGDPLAMSFDGDNFEVLTNLDGTEVAIMKMGDTMYIKRPATKQYVELTGTVMNMLGFDPETFNFSFGDNDYDTMQSKLSATYDVTVNGEAGVCHEYINDTQIIKFYSVDGQLKQINLCDADGKADTQIMIDYLSESIPGDQMTLKGYEKASMGAIFADMM